MRTPCPDCESTGWIIKAGDKAKPCLRTDCIEGGGYVDDADVQEEQPTQTPKSTTTNPTQPRQPTQEEQAEMRAMYGGPYGYGI